MIEGGKRLARVKHQLQEAVAVGTSAFEINELAVKLIKKEGAQASFKMVPGYSWATCVNVNDGVVHGIPKKEVIFANGDVVSVDVGLFYKGYHLDTSFTVDLAATASIKRFLRAGKEALTSGIKAAISGMKVFDISSAIERVLNSYGYVPVNGLVGHGIGKNLHEFPQIPCTVKGSSRENSEELMVGNTLAIEVMYSMGNGEIILDKDGWTIKAKDGKITGLFEDTILVSEAGSVVLTDF